MRRRAFTLIEMIAAMAIGLLLLATVVQTFRSIVQTVKVVNLQRRENDLLRAGFVQVLDDADFYHSEANPDPPFSKGWSRAPLTAADPADKRHFARVLFAQGTAPADPYAAPTAPAALRAHAGLPILPNPNVLLPSDPRSWVRVETVTNTVWGYLRPSYQRAQRFVIGCWLQTDQVWGMGQLASATDMRDLQAFGNGTRRMPEDGVWVGPGRAVDPYRNQTLPALQASLWHQLSHIGVWAYLRPGAPMICHDTRGFLPAWRSLQGGQIASTPTPPFYPTVQASQSQTDYLNGPSASECTTAIGRWGISTTYEGTLGRSDTLRRVAIQVKPVYPTDTALGGFSIANADQWNTDATYKRVMNGRPWFRDFYGWGNTQIQGRDQSRSPAFTSTTYRFPSNATDTDRPTVANTGTATINPTALDLAGRPADWPVMSTSILRQHAFLGDQVVYCRVTVRMPETGRLLELPVSPVCTTYRGARQHWARVTSTTLATPAGDAYVP